MSETQWNLVHRESLLQQLADALEEHEAANRRLTNLKVTLWLDSTRLVEVYSLQIVLNYLVNDIHWDETGDWRHANRLTVETY